MATSHSRTVPSAPPLVARILPSGLNATASTPVSVRRLPVCRTAVMGDPTCRSWDTFHSRAVPSLPPVTRILPFGLNATASTPLSRPLLPMTAG